MIFKEITFNSEEYQRALDLRRRILRKPLGLTFSPEYLAGEKDQYHLAAFDNQQLIAVVLLQKIDSKTAKMKQFAVEPVRQGQGIGRDLTLFAENFCREKKIDKIELHARETAIAFYEKLGYRSIGEKFIEVSIPHIKMWKLL